MTGPIPEWRREVGRTQSAPIPAPRQTLCSSESSELFLSSCSSTPPSPSASLSFSCLTPSYVRSRSRPRSRARSLHHSLRASRSIRDWHYHHLQGLDFDRDGLNKMKKALKTIYNGGNAHVDNEVYLSKALDKLGSNAMTRDQEPEIGAAFIKFSIVTKELSALMKTLMQNLNNVVLFPLDNILKGELKGVKGDLKKPFDKAWREYETKLNKLEKERKQQAKDGGRSDGSPNELADEMDKERKLLQLQMCDYLLKANDIKTKKGVELLQHMVDYYHAQTSYFQDGLKTIEHFNSYINELSEKIAMKKVKQEDERKKLLDVRNILKSSAPYLDTKDATSNALVAAMNQQNEKKDKTDHRPGGGIYHLHQLQGNKHYGYFKTGYLLKKSEGKMRMKIWQKRKCECKDGNLWIYHSDETKPPTQVNLLTCQIKQIPDDRRAFDLVACNRTYRFQTEDDNESEAWVSVLANSKEDALQKEFDGNNDSDSKLSTGIGTGTSDGRYPQNLLELRQTIMKQVFKLPGNDKCVDCNSTKDPTWLSTNYGVLVCIECSGIHRDMGVHISRIQSLTLDKVGTSQLLLARVMSNNGFNETMEATLRSSEKPTSTSSMSVRNEYIRSKYVAHKFALRSCNGVIMDMKNDLEVAVHSRNLMSLLQVFAEGADLGWILPSYTNGETALHLAISQEDGHTLHLVDFLIQNSTELLDKQSKDGNTPLHWCVQFHQSECMKLLLRSGADPNKKNAEWKTPLEMAKEENKENLVELLEHAMKTTKKTLFENVNIDWNLNGAAEDASTDFSDDDLGDDKNQSKNYVDWLVSGYNSVKKTINGGSKGDRDPDRSGGGLFSSGYSSMSKKQLRKLSLSSWEQSNSMPVPGSNVSPDQQHRQSTLRSRPSSVVGSDSPSSRSSGSFKTRDHHQSSIRRSSAGGVMGQGSHHGRSSFKKRTSILSPSTSSKAGLAEVDSPQTNGMMDHKRHGRDLDAESDIVSGNGIYAHIRSPTDVSAPTSTPIYAQISNARSSGHWRNRSMDTSTSSFLANGSDTKSSPPMAKVTPSGNGLFKGTPTSLVLSQPHYTSPMSGPNSLTHQQQAAQQAALYQSLQRPKCPPPPLPPHQVKTTPIRSAVLSDGRSQESLGSPDETMTLVDHRTSSHIPAPPPRKYYFQRQDLAPMSGKIRRCQALYDCEADREDELSFKEGDIILIVSEKTDDEDWMEGLLESDMKKRGLFPSSFVQVLTE